jgi:hypothetical protein
MYILPLVAVAGLMYTYTIVITKKFMLKNINPIILPS